LLQVLRRDLVRAIRKKRPQLDLERVILHQDNAPGHRAGSTQLEISLLGFDVLEHPPYSPDLAPMDFRVFPELKASLRGIRFDSATELTKHSQMIVSSFSEDWYKETFSKWVDRHKKCVEIAGDYVEKVRRSLDLNDA
jgi:histone-lysine N-methyltransferase SETMAR